VADIEITETSLVVHIRGVDRLLALAARVDVPLQHVASVEVNPPDAHDAFHGWRMGGTNVPGIVTAGRFVQHGEWAFWDVHDPARCIAIRLHDESYARLVVGVDDPQGTAAAVNSVLARQ
jgi:phage terminase large subunit-like protein